VMRERVCRLQFLLVLASIVILGFESGRTHDHILLPQIRDSPNLEGLVPVFISPRNRVPFSSPPTTRRATVEPPYGLPKNQAFTDYNISNTTSRAASPVVAWVWVHITTDGQSASLSWNKTPIWGLRPDFCYCQTVAGLLMWGALSDERTGLPFTIAVGPRQGSHFRVRVPWGSWPYFTISDSRLPFSSPPTTRRVTVEVFEPASTQDIVAA
jgi:hypothetical protein